MRTCWATSVRSAGSIPSPAKRWKSPCSSRGRTAWAQSSNTHSSPTSTIPSVSMRWRCASTTSSARARSRCFSSIILRRAGFRPKRWLRSCPASRRGAARRAAPSSAGRLRKCPAFMRTASTTSPGSPSASSIKRISSTARTFRRATRSSASLPAASIPTAIRWSAACSATAAIRATLTAMTTA